MKTSAVGLFLFMWAASPSLAQRTYSAEQVREGGRLFSANCVACHGPKGDQVPGIDFGRGMFRRPSSDEALVQSIREGIQGTAMPPSNFGGPEASAIVAYMRALHRANQSASVKGDAAKGRAIFEGKGGCTSCHRVGDTGSRVGPELSEIGLLRGAADLEKSLLDPNAEVLPQNRSFRATMRDGEKISGRLLNQDMFSVQVLDSHERLLSLRKSEMRETVFLDDSPMPSYRAKLNSQEMTDLLAYLISLRGF